MTEGTLKFMGAQRATYESRASLTRVQSHIHQIKQHCTSLHVGSRLRVRRQLQHSMSRTADVHRGGTFSRAFVKTSKAMLLHM